MRVEPVRSAAKEPMHANKIIFRFLLINPFCLLRKYFIKCESIYNNYVVSYAFCVELLGLIHSILFLQQHNSVCINLGLK
jgi:hypothetical protein